MIRVVDIFHTEIQNEQRGVLKGYVSMQSTIVSPHFFFELVNYSISEGYTG